MTESKECRRVGWFCRCRATIFNIVAVTTAMPPTGREHASSVGDGDGEIGDDCTAADVFCRVNGEQWLKMDVMRAVCSWVLLRYARLVFQHSMPSCEGAKYTRSVFSTWAQPLAEKVDRKEVHHPN